jgi:hypothetical protein
MPAAPASQTARSSSLCFITPTHSVDLPRFALLRRSIRRFAAEPYRHLALVNTEDCAEFRDHFAADADLQIVPSADILPKDIEQRRKKSGRWWRKVLVPKNRPIKGWYAQQIMKLFALAECPTEAAVFIDSDVFLCKPLPADFFLANGSLTLFRRRARDAEGFDFDISTHDILGNPLHQVTELFDYIYSPCSFRKSTAVALFAEFAKRRRNTWIRRFLAERRPSEYNLLGYAASVLEGLRGYNVVECEPSALHHSIRFPEDRSRLAAEFDHMVHQPKHFALVQSTLGIEPAEIQRGFDRLAGAQS